MAKEAAPAKPHDDDITAAINKTTEFLVSKIEEVSSKLDGYPPLIREVIVNDKTFKSALAKITGASGGSTRKHFSDEDVEKLLAFCAKPHTATEIVSEIGFTIQTIIKQCSKLVEAKKLKKTDGKYQAN